MTTDHSASIFGNAIDERTYRKACRSKERFARKFGDDSDQPCPLSADWAPVVGERLGVRRIVPATAGAPAGAGARSNTLPFDLRVDASSLPAPENQLDGRTGTGEPVIVGTIRMGFGHYRIAMAMASAAHALGYRPYWMDLTAFPDTTASKVIGFQNDLYSLGSRISQVSHLFNSLVWEPMNSEGFRKLSYNASDQKVAELMVAPFGQIDRTVPFIGTHAWPSQAAVHAGMRHVVNAIPDNWPMALHLAEGSVHTVQTPSSYLGYRRLRGMDKRRQLSPMPASALVCTGHYVDHELVLNLKADCARRRARLAAGGPVRYLLSVGGAGAQEDLFRGIIEHLLPSIEAGRAALFVNVGDHLDVWRKLAAQVPALEAAQLHFGDFGEAAAFAQGALDGAAEGIHAFYQDDIFGAVYSTNLLMRACDVLVTKPSELSFYPVPKLMIHRVGGHEAWGAIRAAEVGDGTYELDSLEETCAMIDLMQSDPGIIAWMCDNIEAADARGTYDGAYRVVQLAMGQRG